MNMFIYKFQDLTDFDSAYVIVPHGQESKALRMVKEITALDVKLAESRPIDDFPKAREYYEAHGEGIWISRILPF